MLSKEWSTSTAADNKYFSHSQLSGFTLFLDRSLIHRLENLVILYLSLQISLFYLQWLKWLLLTIYWNKTLLVHLLLFVPQVWKGVLKRWLKAKLMFPPSFPHLLQGKCVSVKRILTNWWNWLITMSWTMRSWLFKPCAWQWHEGNNGIISHYPPASNLHVLFLGLSITWRDRDVWCLPVIPEVDIMSPWGCAGLQFILFTWLFRWADWNLPVL